MTMDFRIACAGCVAATPRCAGSANCWGASSGEAITSTGCRKAFFPLTQHANTVLRRA